MCAMTTKHRNQKLGPPFVFPILPGLLVILGLLARLELFNMLIVVIIVGVSDGESEGASETVGSSEGAPEGSSDGA